MAKHAFLSPSAAHRWMNCPAAPRLEAQFPDEPGEEASKGTVAHSVVEDCLVRWNRGDRTFAGAYRGEVRKADGREFEVDETMVEACDLYLEHIRQIIDADPLGEANMLPEREVKLPFVYRGLAGTCDTSVEYPLDRLFIRDFKHGQGVQVFAQENPQIRIYALGALWDPKAKDYIPVETVDLGIGQPRIFGEDGSPHFDYEVMKASDLIEWGQEVLRPACKAASRKGAAPCAGEWCRFCKANGPGCPEVSALRMEQAQAAFLPIASGETTYDPVDPSQLTPEQLRRVWEAAKEISKWVENVHRYLYRALDEGLIRYEDIGLKLVAGRANRDWIDPDGAVAFAEAQGVDPYGEPKLRSVKQMEDAIKATMPKNTDRAKELIKTMNDKLVTVSHGKQIVPMDHKKPAIPQEVGFQKIEDNDQ